MKIRVRLKSTGQTGTIDDSEFNPQEFDRLDQPIQQIQTPQQQSLGQRIGGGVTRLAQGFAQSPKRLGEGLGTLGEMLFGKDRKGLKESQEQLEKMSQKTLAKAAEMRKQGKFDDVRKLLQVSGQGTKLLQQQAQEQATAKSKALEDVIKGGVGTGGMLLTGGQTAGARIGLAALSGAAGGFGASERGEELQSILGGAVGGAAIGGVFEGAGALNKYIKGRQQLAKGGKFTVTGSKVKGTPNWSKRVKAMKKTGLQIGLSDDMSSLTQMDEIFKATKNASKDVKTLAKNSNPVDGNRLAEIFESVLDEKGLDINDVFNTKQGKAILGRLQKASGDNVKLLNLKSAASSEMKKLFQRGGKVSSNEQAWSVIFDTLVNATDDMSPQIKVINNFQRDLYDLAAEKSGLGKKAYQQVSLTIPFTRGADIPTGITREAFQKGVRGTGKVIAAPFKAAGKVTGAATEAVQAPITRNALIQRILFPGQQQGAGQPAQQQPGLDQVLQQPTQQPTQQPQQNKIPNDLLTLGLLSGKINAADVEALKSLGLVEEAPGKGKASQGLALVDELEKSFGTVQQAGLAAPGGGIGRIIGAVKGQAGAISQVGKGGQKAAVYKSVRKAFLAKLARALGEKGTLAKDDVERIEGVLPKFSDSPEVAAGKMQQLRAIISSMAEE